MLHPNNASSHTAGLTAEFLKQKQIKVIEHPPYSPDLAMCVKDGIDRKLQSSEFKEELYGIMGIRGINTISSFALPDIIRPSVTFFCNDTTRNLVPLQTFGGFKLRSSMEDTPILSYNLWLRREAEGNDSNGRGSERRDMRTQEKTLRTQERQTPSAEP
ncbi:hypothetical protein TNCV_4623011 [Trichonephila clavipes]|nr:hypothetical protein TNCV_4623011 [Trichonephila clavipes]